MFVVLDEIIIGHVKSMFVFYDVLHFVSMVVLVFRIVDDADFCCLNRGWRGFRGFLLSESRMARITRVCFRIADFADYAE